MNLVFATGNPNKVREINQVLPGSITVQSLADIGITGEIPETSDTIEGNSLQKALYLKEELGLEGFAEDTGLEVEALDGAPGIYSARYAGPQKDADDNMDLLLSNMAGISNRKARFRTVITLTTKEGTVQFEGILSGEIGLEKRGDNGFGYDPVFIIAGGKTLAELSAEEKALISHRGQAVRKLIDFLQKQYI
jgi:XTP/dITP diphosphohydrolase